MPCYAVENPGFEGIMFICGEDIQLDVRRSDECCFIDDYLCDYPVGEGKTCDKPLCTKHANEIAPDIHYCTHHYDEWLRFKISGGVRRELQNVIAFR